MQDSFLGEEIKQLIIAKILCFIRSKFYDVHIQFHKGINFMNYMFDLSFIGPERYVHVN